MRLTIHSREWLLWHVARNFYHTQQVLGLVQARFPAFPAFCDASQKAGKANIPGIMCTRYEKNFPWTVDTLLMRCSKPKDHTMKREAASVGKGGVRASNFLALWWRNSGADTTNRMVWRMRRFQDIQSTRSSSACPRIAPDLDCWVFLKAFCTVHSAGKHHTWQWFRVMYQAKH